MTDSSERVQVYNVPARLLDPSQCPTPHVPSLDKYKEMYEASLNDPDTFWSKMAHDLLSWEKPFTKVSSGGFENGDVKWFEDGTLNAAYNCVDRHAHANPDKVAIIYEADDSHESRKVTYGELYREVKRLANLLLSLGTKKGDSVAVYLPMIPEAAVAFLACARIGCTHSVIFAGFSAESLRERMKDAGSKILITADEGKRGGKTIATKKIADEALEGLDCVKHVIVYKRTGGNVPFSTPRDLWWHEEIEKQSDECPPTPVSAEDPLFLLYTSGSTGKPKGVLHTTGGYLLGAAMTVKYIFDYQEGDIHGCMADVGWITGHTYIIYGPLCLGATTLIFESVPTYPDASRYWAVVDKYRITQLYLAPTAIRALRRLGDSWVEKHDLSSLRVLGSVGEPINPEAWLWYYEKVGRGRCSIVDTYWQTETGSIIITPLPGCTPTRPGSATFPFFGIQPAVLDPYTGEELKGENVTGVLAVKRPWPSMARTVYGDHPRFLDTYLRPYPGYYFTGDGVTRDEDGYYWIRGRVDDVINVSGHRLSTAEIESALIHHPAVAEAAVIGGHDDVTGQSIHVFATIKPHAAEANETVLTKELVLQVRTTIGPFAAPKRIYIVADLPKTRSGKIMRRILRKVVAGEADQLGDISTLADPHVVAHLIEKVAA
ncbi:uncharacterized protein VTP21DRAFT_11178 [Calcarisporiella thermophila]|uniref:uncharacterized protein n=1 Tax=Calcarisporiella thermophila TaxID=911321 RepID=UPI003743AEE7